MNCKVLSLCAIGFLIISMTSSRAQVLETNDITLVNFGVLLPMTGTYSDYFQPVANSAYLGMNALNEEFGNSYVFNLTFYDTQSTIDGADSALQQAITDGMVFVIGPMSSPAVRGSIQRAVDHQIPMISYGASYPDLSYINDHASAGDPGYLWRTSINHQVIGNVIGDLVNAFGFQNIKIIYNSVDYNVQIDNATVARINQFGGINIVNTIYNPQTISSDINTDISSNVDWTFLLLNPDEIVNVLNTLYTLGSPSAVMVDADLLDQQFFNNNTLLPGATSNVALVKTEEVHDSPIATQFYKDYYGNWSNSQGVTYHNPRVFDAILAAGKAVAATGSTLGSDIILGLSNVNFEGASGHIQFDSNGDRTEDYYLMYSGNLDETSLVAKFNNTLGFSYLEANWYSEFPNGRQIIGSITTSESQSSDHQTTVDSIALPIDWESSIFGLFILIPLIRIQRRKNSYI